MGFAYTRACGSSLAEVVEAVGRALLDHGFVIERTHDLRERMTAKGFTIQPVHVFEARATIAPGVASPAEEALIVRCRVSVYLEGDTVYVSAVRPAALWRALGAGAAARRARAVDERLCAVVDALAERGH